MDRVPLQMWLAHVWNCEHAFEVVCPGTWDQLRDTGTAGVRQCDTCQQPVHRVETPDEFVRHGRAGHCVCIPAGHAPIRVAMTDVRGRPSPASVEAAAERARRVRAWWERVAAHRPDFAPAAMTEIVRVFGPRDEHVADPQAHRTAAGSES